MTTPLNVLHVTTGMGEGGAEAMLARLISHSDPSRIRHHLLALSREGPLWEPTSRHCVSVLNLQLERPLAAISRLLRLLGFVRESRPDVIHGWMYHGNLAASWLRNRYAPNAAMVLGIRQSLYDIRRERPLTRVVIREGARHSQTADAIVYNSRVSLEQHSALGYRRDRSRIVANGFDTRRFIADPAARKVTRTKLGITDSEFVVGMVGRFHPIKDHATFLRAAGILAREHAAARILIVGPGCSVDNPGLRALVNRYAGAARVELLGASSTIETLYPALDALCLTSLAEGFPNVVGEAMSCGVVCVCTNVGDVSTLVGEAGYLCPVGDFDSLASCLLKLARMDPAQRSTAGNMGRERIAGQFGIEVMVDAYMRLYSELVVGGERPLAAATP